MLTPLLLLPSAPFVLLACGDQRTTPADADALDATDADTTRPPTMRVFGEVWLLTEGGPARLTEVLAVYLYRQAFRYHEFGSASATGLAMLAISLVIALPYLHQAYRRMFRHAAA